MAIAIAELISRLLVVFQLVVQQVQYISLFNQLDLKWPEGFREGYTDMEIINVNLRSYVANVELPVVSFRGLFTIISIMIPILITLCVLILFQPFLVVILYISGTFGCVVLIAGLIGRYLTAQLTLDVDSDTSKSYIIAGAIMAGSAFTIVMWIKIKSHQRKQTKGLGETVSETDKAALQQKDLYYDQFHRVRTFRHMLSTILLILVGLTLTGLLNFGMNSVLASTTINIWIYVGYVFLVLGVINAVYFVACLSQWGRRAQVAVTNFISRNGLMILLVSIGSTFIPVITYAIQIMMCKTYTCPAGSSFNPYANRPVGNWDTSEQRYCDTCTFLNTDTCSSTSNVTALCPGFNSRRSWLYPDTACDDQASGMFRAAAILALAGYGISIPAIFYFVIRYLSTKINSISYPGENGDDASVQWSKRITLVKPVASSMYDAFNFSSRYFVLVSILQRVLIMIILLIVAPFSQNAVVGVFIVYLVYCMFMLYAKPYLHGLEKGLATGMAIVNVFNGAVALYVWKQDVSSGKTLWGIFVAANIAIPLIATFIGYKRSPSLPTAADVDLPDRAVKDNEANQRLWDQKTGRIHMSRFFMTMGILFVIAFGACIVGMLRTPTNTWLTSTNPLYQTNAQVLAGYSDWTTMTQSCCCVETANPSGNFLVGERWLCNNGKVIERGREDVFGRSSLSLRDVCGVKPLDSRCVISTSSKGVPYMNCPSAVKDEYVPSVIDAIAYEYYF